jgi:hypothetical protein
VGEIVPATVSHAHSLAATMRADDASEVAALGLTPLDALLESLRASEVALTLLFDSEPAVMWGAEPVRRTLLSEPVAASVWCLTGTGVERHRKDFARVSRAGVAALIARYPVLFADVDARYARSLRWVRWLGFTVLPAVPFGVSGEPFHPIVLER